MPTYGKAASNGGQQSEKAHSKYSNSLDRDIESNKPLASPQTPTFPGATYGLNPSDQPSHPPRRVRSSHSLKHSRSGKSLRTDPGVPPPLPSSRSSHNIFHQPPQTGNTTNTNVDGEGDDESLSEELAWGPSHPCYPHMNPHVPLSSPSYISTRIIRVRRDWMVAGDLAPTYSNVYPEILDPLLPEPEFRHIINHINTTLLDAFDPFSTLNWIDGFFGFVTGWLWEDFRPNVGFKGKIRGLEKWMEEWNDRVGFRDGVKLISLRRTGYMGLDIQIPDPQVRVVDDGDDLDERDQQREQDGDGQDLDMEERRMGHISTR